jgi:hypothetical protein
MIYTTHMFLLKNNKARLKNSHVGTTNGRETSPRGEKRTCVVDDTVPANMTTVFRVIAIGFVA